MKITGPSPSLLPETVHPGRHIPDPRDEARCSVKHETCWLRLIRLTRFTSDQLSGWRGGAGCYDVSTSYNTIACNVGVQPGVEMNGYGRGQRDPGPGCPAAHRAAPGVTLSSILHKHL